MAHRKRRVYQHIMADESIKLIRSYLPSEWVIREYNPDYGIDIVVEVFEYVDEERLICEAVGDMFFVQVKAVKKADISLVKVYSRKNVEKYSLLELKDDWNEIEVVKFSLDTDELLTIQSMGAGVPVFLFLVCLQTNRIFYVCLNDLIDKVIIPTDKDVYSKKEKTIYIPIKNEIMRDGKSVHSLRFLAKRMKMYAAFIRFIYQKNCIDDFVEVLADDRGIDEYIEIRNYLNQTLHFIDVLKRLDIWSASSLWGVIGDMYFQLVKMEDRIRNVLIDVNRVIDEDKFDDDSFLIEGFEWSPPLIINEIKILWDSLVNISDIYEEICREWCLPTYLAEELRS